LTRSLSRLSVAGLVLLGALLPMRPAAGQASPQWYGQGFGKNKIQYRDFSWQIYRSPHFNVYFYKEEEPSLQKVVSFAESAYDQLSRGFNFQIKDPIPIIYYATHSAFEQNNVLLNFIPEGVGAFASPARFRMVLPIDMPDAELMELLLHEMTHIFEYHMLFQGSLAKAVATSPPTWFMEGLASYMAKDETARDKMFLRDAVVNDRIPPISRVDFQGFFAYRFGHAVFDFIEERWGRDGFLDFLYEIRNTVGSRPDRAVQRAFKLEPEEFDIEFRRWLRKKYLPQLVETGEPSDFGRLFRVRDDSLGSGGDGRETSPAASPSGDLVAAVSVASGDVDVVLFDARKRVQIRNLTKGYSNEYQYLVAQETYLGRLMGRDIAFSPDANSIAVFAKREKARSLLLLDVLNGGIRQMIDLGDLEQPLAPAFSPDGRTLAFSAWRNGRFDIYLLDLESREIKSFTNDDIYDGAPVFSPDGKSIVCVSVVGNGYGKLFRIDLDKPGQRYQLTGGDSNENDPVYSPDGKRVYFTSDRDGRDNIYSLDLASGEVKQHTNVVTGAFMPTVLRDIEEGERLVFTGFWKGTFNLYVTNVDEPVKEPTKEAVPVEPAQAQDLPRFEPDIQVTLDDANRDKYGGFKFFLEDAQAYAGFEDQIYTGRVLLTFSDYLGNRRILADLSSVSSFQNFDIVYADYTHRLQWQAHVFDERQYYVQSDFLRNRPDRIETALQQTGAIGSLVYPFTFYTRAEIGAGYLYRKYNFPQVSENPETGEQNVEFIPIVDDFPLVTGALIGDSAGFASYGPIAGRRWRFDLLYAPDLDESGALLESADIDFRQYFAVTQRSNLAFRAFVGANKGNRPSPIYIGGMDTVRGLGFRTLTGDRAFFTNAEYRFPLIDVVATPILAFQGIRGVIFLDVGGAWYNDFETFDFYDSDTGRLRDGIAAYGWGVTVRFLGFDLNWDFAQRWDLKDKLDSRTSFWIGTRF
jgi:hypothetical protein